MYQFQLFPLHCPRRNAISSKVFNEFSKPFFWPNDEERGYRGWKFKFHRNFGFAIPTLQLFQHLENVKISIFPFTLSRKQKCWYLQKYLQYNDQFFKNFFLAISSKVFNEQNEDEGGYCGWKFQFHRNFGFARATLHIFQHPENVKISISPSHCPSRNAISSKVFNEFSKTFFWLKDDEGGYCCWKFQVHRYFGFAIATLQIFQHPEM